MRRSTGSRLAISVTVLTSAVVIGPAVAQESARTDELEGIVVTGSLIQRGATAVSPIVSVSDGYVYRRFG